MTDNKAQQIHPAQRLSTPNLAEADIDVEMVPLVRALLANRFPAGSLSPSIR